jgi:uncharacterized membrane protein
MWYQRLILAFLGAFLPATGFFVAVLFLALKFDLEKSTLHLAVWLVPASYITAMATFCSKIQPYLKEDLARFSGTILKLSVVHTLAFLAALGGTLACSLVIRAAGNGSIGDGQLAQWVFLDSPLDLIIASLTIFIRPFAKRTWATLIVFTALATVFADYMDPNGFARIIAGDYNEGGRLVLLLLQMALIACTASWVFASTWNLLSPGGQHD